MCVWLCVCVCVCDKPLQSTFLCSCSERTFASLCCILCSSARAPRTFSTQQTWLGSDTFQTCLRQEIGLNLPHLIKACCLSLPLHHVTRYKVHKIGNYRQDIAISDSRKHCESCTFGSNLAAQLLLCWGHRCTGCLETWICSSNLNMGPRKVN